MMDGETKEQETEEGCMNETTGPTLSSETSHSEQEDDSGTDSPQSQPQNDESPQQNDEQTNQEEPQREPVKIHIKLSELKRFHTKSDAFTRKRKPKWYCYQCRITFFARIHLDNHLREHVEESKVGVKLVRLPLPADVVATASKRYRDAELNELALKQSLELLEKSSEIFENSSEILENSSEILENTFSFEGSSCPLSELPLAIPQDPPLVDEVIISDIPEIVVDNNTQTVTSSECLPMTESSPNLQTSENPSLSSSPSTSSSSIVFSNALEVKLLESNMKSAAPSNVEPERCQSVMIIDSEPTIASSQVPKVSIVKSSSSPLSLLSQIDPSRRFNSLTQPPNGSHVPMPPRSTQQWGGQMVVQNTLQQSTPRIQEVVSLANPNRIPNDLRSAIPRHVNDDPDSSCCCEMCMEIRCGDLLKKSLYPAGGGEQYYRCVICSIQFARKNHLLRHCRVSRHSFLCELCGSGFLTQNLFQLHTKLHVAKQQSAAAKSFSSVVNSSILSGAVVATTSTQNRPTQLTPSTQHTLRNVDALRAQLARNMMGAPMNPNAGQNKNVGGGGVYFPPPARPVQNVLNRNVHDDEIVVLGEKRQVAQPNQQRPPPMQRQISAAVNSTINKINSSPPTQLSRILHNSEITLTPISTSDASNNDSNKNSNGSQLLQQLKRTSAMPNTTLMQNSQQIGVRTPQSAGNQSELRRVMTTINANHINSTQPNQSGPTRPLLTQSNVYRMMPVNKSMNNMSGGLMRRPVSSVVGRTPTWHHPVVSSSTFSSPSMSATNPRPPFQMLSGLRYPLPPSLINSGRQLMQNNVSNMGKTVEETPPNKFPFSNQPGFSSANSMPPRLIPSGTQNSGQPVRTPPGITPVRCHVCNLVFHSIVTFQVHFDTVHKRPHTQQMYKCSRCSKIYTQHAHLRRHETLCNEKVLCKKCNQSFYRNELLAHYTQAHIGSNLEFGTPVTGPPRQQRPILPKPTSTTTITPIPTSVDQSAAAASDANGTTDGEDVVEVIPETETSVTPAETLTPVVVEVEEEVQEELQEEATEPTNEDNVVVESEEVGVEPEEPKESEEEVVKELADKIDDERPVEEAIEEPAVICEPEEAMQTEIEIAAPLEVTLAEHSSDDVSAIEMKDVDSEPIVAQPIEESVPDIAVQVAEPLEEVAQEAACESNKIALVTISCPVCDQTFHDHASLQDHVQMHCEMTTSVTRKYICAFCQVGFEECRQLSVHLRTHFASCNRVSPKTPPAKRPRLSPVKTSPAETESKSGLAVAILDMNKMAASSDILRRLGVVGFVSLNDLKSYILSEDNTSSLNFMKSV